VSTEGCCGLTLKPQRLHLEGPEGESNLRELNKVAFRFLGPFRATSLNDCPCALAEFGPLPQPGSKPPRSFGPLSLMNDEASTGNPSPRAGPTTLKPEKPGPSSDGLAVGPALQVKPPTRHNPTFTEEDLYPHIDTSTLNIAPPMLSPNTPLDQEAIMERGPIGTYQGEAAQVATAQPPLPPQLPGVAEGRRKVKHTRESAEPKRTQLTLEQTIARSERCKDSRTHPPNRDAECHGNQ